MSHLSRSKSDRRARRGCRGRSRKISDPRAPPTAGLFSHSRRGGNGRRRFTDSLASPKRRPEAWLSAKQKKKPRPKPGLKTFTPKEEEKQAKVSFYKQAPCQIGLRRLGRRAH
jgi:hypothetical protein